MWGPEAVQGRVWPQRSQQGRGKPWVALTVTLPHQEAAGSWQEKDLSGDRRRVDGNRGEALGSHKPTFLSIKRSGARLGWSPAAEGGGHSWNAPFVATDTVVWGTSSRRLGLECPIFGMEGPGAVPDTVPMGRMGSGLCARSTLAAGPLCADPRWLSPCPLACLLASSLPSPSVLPGPQELSLPCLTVQTPKSNTGETKLIHREGGSLAQDRGGVGKCCLLT